MSVRGRVAVLGGGGAGSCVALELAAHGVGVDVLEQDDRPVLRASRVNEGKIHLGFLYAKDPSERTAALMARGALTFADHLSRWLGLTAGEHVLSTPFHYAVHRQSQVGVERLRRHYEGCCSRITAMEDDLGTSYLGRGERASVRELSRREIAELLDPDEFLTVFETSERSVDPRVVADRLRTAVTDEPRITFRGATRVAAVERDGRDRFRIVLADGTREGPYEQVVNAAWCGRLAIDRTMGLAPARPWLHRHKFGNRVRVPLAPGALPSVTMVLGAFGDIVNFGDHGLYLSWYPTGMVATSQEADPGSGWAALGEADRLAVFRRSLEVWRGFCPRLDAIPISDADVDASSGVIFAWGDSDIDDPASELHERHAIGVTSAGGYHSVNTGKYTTMPLLAMEAARRVLGAG